MSSTGRRHPTTFSVSHDGPWAWIAENQYWTRYFTVRLGSYGANHLRSEFAQARSQVVRVLALEFRRTRKRNKSSKHGWLKWKRGFGKRATDHFVAIQPWR